MAVAVERRPQRLIDPRHQRADVVVALDVVLQDGEFIAAEAGDEVLGPDRLAQPVRDALEEFVADQMSQRIVDALELVDVDIEDRELRRLRSRSSNPSAWRWNSVRFGRLVRAS